MISINKMYVILMQSPEYSTSVIQSREYSVNQLSVALLRPPLLWP